MSTIDLPTTTEYMSVLFSIPSFYNLPTIISVNSVEIQNDGCHGIIPMLMMLTIQALKFKMFNDFLNSLLLKSFLE